jgi:hypothetical protein
MYRPHDVALLILLTSAFCLAQAPIPGTFSTAPVDVNSGLVLTTPMMSLGNGISPPVVTNQQSLVVGAPVGGAVFSTAVPGSAANGGRPPAPTGDLIHPEPSQMGFDASGDTRSLGEVAALYRNRESQQPAVRVYTNDDIRQLYDNAAAPPASPEGPAMAAPAQAGEAPQSQQQTQQHPRQYSVPVGSKPPGDVVPAEQQPTQTESGDQNGNAKHSPFSPKVEQAAPNQPSGGEQQMAAPMPRTASLLPLLGALGGSLIAGGLIYRSLRH